MTGTDAAAVAGKLSEAQREAMLGHLVEIPPEEADQLIKAGLKGEITFEWVRVRRMTWPITPLGLAVRAHLLASPGTET